MSVSGGEAKYLSLSFIIEEGFPFRDLERVVESIRATAEKAGVSIVTGDTKVVEKGRGDGIYINTAGIGVLKYPGLSPRNIRPGDAILLSGTAGDHGAAVMLSRSGLEGTLQSDCAPLNRLCAVCGIPPGAAWPPRSTSSPRTPGAPWCCGRRTCRCGRM